VGESELIEVRLDDLLERQQRSFYWLAKQTGISYTTLWRLKKARALGINFATLEKICEALKCQPGDVLSLQETQASKRAHVPAARSKRKTS
jgi:putative transcriptional regulator